MKSAVVEINEKSSKFMYVIPLCFQLMQRRLSDHQMLSDKQEKWNIR